MLVLAVRTGIRPKVEADPAADISKALSQVRSAARLGTAPASTPGHRSFHVKRLGHAHAGAWSAVAWEDWVVSLSEAIVVRHGQSAWNEQRRWAGQADPPLTELGRKQAAELARRCRSAGIAAVASSDLSRARQTALIVAHALEVEAPIELPDLRERWSNTLTGLTADEIEQAHPEALAAWRGGASRDLPGDSESFESFASRVLRGLHSAAGLASVVLVVAHAGVFRVLGETTGSGMNAHLANADGRRLAIGPHGFTDNGPAFEGGDPAAD